MFTKMRRNRIPLRFHVRDGRTLLNVERQHPVRFVEFKLPTFDGEHFAPVIAQRGQALIAQSVHQWRVYGTGQTFKIAPQPLKAMFFHDEIDAVAQRAVKVFMDVGCDWNAPRSTVSCRAHGGIRIVLRSNWMSDRAAFHMLRHEHRYRLARDGRHRQQRRAQACRLGTFQRGCWDA